MKASTFLSNYSAGVIIRVFSTNPDKVEELVEVTKKTIDKLTSTEIEFDGINRVLIKKILIVVWTAQDFLSPESKPLADCGKTYDAMVKEFGGQKGIKIYRENDEDLFCGLLNKAVVKLAMSGCKYSWVISPHAHEYVEAANLIPMVHALFEGAWVSGLALNELEDSILNDGLIANTLAVWDTEKLLTYGGFNKIAAMEKDASKALFMRGYDEVNNKNVYYPYHGVEEIPTLVSFALDNKQVIAPVKNNVKGSYTPPSDPEALKRHNAKMAAKRVRQERHALMGFSANLNIVKKAIMPKYRHK